MADFVESAKNFVSAAVSRTSWEAQKQMRVRGKQGEMDKLLEQRHQLLDELAQVAMNLYVQGALTDGQLSRICASIMELDSDVKNREVQLQDLKKESYPADQSVPGPTPNYTPPAFTPPPAPTTPRSQKAGSAPATPRTARAGAASQMQECPTCGSSVRANALYCRACGAKLR
jgi:zinc-ribbon domain